MLIGTPMKLKAPAVAEATGRLPLGFFFAVFLTIIYASSAVAKTGAAGLNPAETWVVAQVRTGEIADLSKQFPDKEKDKRRLSAHFLEELLTGAPLHRHGVRIIGATIDEPIDLKNAPSEKGNHSFQFSQRRDFTSRTFLQFAPASIRVWRTVIYSNRTRYYPLGVGTIYILDLVRNGGYIWHYKNGPHLRFLL
jgi:hypothetical protein